MLIRYGERKYFNDDILPERRVFVYIYWVNYTLQRYLYFYWSVSIILTPTFCPIFLVCVLVSPSISNIWLLPTPQASIYYGLSYKHVALHVRVINLHLMNTHYAILSRHPTINIILWITNQSYLPPWTVAPAQGQNNQIAAACCSQTPIYLVDLPSFP